jgi:outer membrane protein insertion porin family
MLWKSISYIILSLAPIQEDWEGKEIREVLPGTGWRRHRFENFKSLLNARPGQRYTLEKRSDDYKRLFSKGLFTPDIEIDCKLADGMVVVTVSVVEYDIISDVEFRGHSVFSTAQLAAALRIAPDRYLNPAHLKLDKDTLTEMYVSKGHHFFKVREELQAGARGVRLIWHLDEGPMVSVEKIEFTGNESVSTGDLKDYLLSKENSYLLFIPVGKQPFLERNLREDVERIKIYYSLEGWLDIHNEKPRPRVFLEDVVFNDAKTAVRIRYHVDEGPRYVIKNVKIRGNTLFPEAEIRSWLVSKPGDFYSEKNSGLDVGKIREKYGERAYILAEINAEKIFAMAGHELDLLFDIKENNKVYAGKLNIQGNTKTREDVIRREFTRVGFLPGEEFNSRALERGVTRLRASGWFGGDPTDPTRGVGVKTIPTGPGQSDVTVEVKEGQTGNVRFAAGYSSSFGILGVIEFTQRNFDIADLPKSFDDLISGNGFAGGGQFLRVRFAPAAKRQSGLLEFKEPYFFGEHLGFGIRAYSQNTLRESYDERRTGFNIAFDKPLDPFKIEFVFGGYNIRLSDLDSDAPAQIQDLEGSNLLLSMSLGVVFDTRNSPLFPSEGVKAALIFEYAGQVLGGDFDFNKWTFDSEFYWPIFETESKLKHVVSLNFTFAWADPQRDDLEVPIFERFYAGGRGSIRGFEFRGVGPMENGDPIGGESYLYASLEYTFPLFTEILRGAVFFDVANLQLDLDDFKFREGWRTSVGFGIRFIIPQLSNIPVAIDFGFPLSKEDQDERQTITFDIGRLF